MKTTTLAIYDVDHDFLTRAAKSESRSRVKQFHVWMNELRAGRAIHPPKLEPKKANKK